MNCSMSISPYFYFSNNFLFDFPSSGWFNFFRSWPGSDLGNIRRTILCKMRWRGTIWYSVTVMRISTVTGGKAGYHIRRWPYVVWVRTLCTVQVRTRTFSSAQGLFVLANCYTMAVLFFSGDYKFIMGAGVWFLYHKTHKMAVFNSLIFKRGIK